MSPSPKILTWHSVVDTAFKLIEEEREVKAALRRGTPVSEIVKNLNARAAPKSMSPNRNPPKVSVGPVTTSGDVVRLINEPNGSGRIEIWVKGSGWTMAPPGRIRLDELMPTACRPVSAADAFRLAIPASEWRAPIGAN
jgi:hypothetical protein